MKRSAVSINQFPEKYMICLKCRSIQELGNTRCWKCNSSLIFRSRFLVKRALYRSFLKQIDLNMPNWMNVIKDFCEIQTANEENPFE